MQAELLTELLGKWKGTARTWFHPDQLGDESNVTAEFQPILGGRFVRHTYQGRIQGEPRTGEEIIAFNSVSQKFQTIWIDDFHMNYAIMFSEGEPMERGFSVFGRYDVGVDAPPWGWKTVYELSLGNELAITAYNVSPEGEEQLAVETRYTRDES